MLSYKYFFYFLIIFGLHGTKALNSGGKLQSRSAASIASVKNPFATNSASKTVNLDFRNSNSTNIKTELFKVLGDLLKNKNILQEKVILNVKPPKNSNSTFVKNFTSLLRNGTYYIDPNVVIGVQSTIFKKPNGIISNLRLTLYVVRTQKIAKNKSEIINKSSTKTAKTKVEEAKVNLTNSDNITATVESVLHQLFDNSTENEQKETNILLYLVSAKNFTKNDGNKLERLIRQTITQLYPNSSISINKKLFYRRKSHISNLEFEIDIKPRVLTRQKPLINTISMIIVSQTNSSQIESGDIVISDTNTIDNSTKIIDFYLENLSKHIEGKGINKTDVIITLVFSTKVLKEQKEILKQRIGLITQKIFPNQKTSIDLATGNGKYSNELHLLIQIKPKIESISTSIRKNLKKLETDIQNIQPFSQVLKGAENIIKKDLLILQETLEMQKEKYKIPEFHIDLTENSPNFSEKLAKVLPQVFSILQRSSGPVTLAFEVRIFDNSLINTMSPYICSILKTLIREIPAVTQRGDDVNIEVTLSTEPTKRISLEENEEIRPSVSYGVPIVQRAYTKFPSLLNNEIQKKLNIEKYNIPEEYNGNSAYFLNLIPTQNVTKRTLNLTMILPHNETGSLEDYLVNIIRRDLKILWPYSQVLIQAQKIIANDLNLLKLDVGLEHAYEEVQSEKNMEIIPIDLSNLEENIQKDLDEYLTPVISNITRNKPFFFDLELRPVNDIGRPRLSNEIISIIDNLFKFLPKNERINVISLRMTVVPNEENKEKVKSEDFKIKPTPTIMNIKDSSKNISDEILKELKYIIGGLKNNQKSRLVVHIPRNKTRRTIQDKLSEIKNVLSRLAPYVDTIIKSQEDLEDDVLKLQLEIDSNEQQPRKKFRIILTDSGDFVPEEVDEIVYDLRNSQNLFSFNLEMVIPAGIDMEAGSSEICSVINIVINNIPKQSILKNNILRVGITPVGYAPLVPTEEQQQAVPNTKITNEEVEPRAIVQSNYPIERSIRNPLVSDEQNLNEIKWNQQNKVTTQPSNEEKNQLPNAWKITNEEVEPSATVQSYYPIERSIRFGSIRNPLVSDEQSLNEIKWNQQNEVTRQPSYEEKNQLPNALNINRPSMSRSLLNSFNVPSYINPSMNSIYPFFSRVENSEIPQNPLNLRNENTAANLRTLTNAPGLNELDENQTVEMNYQLKKPTTSMSQPIANNLLKGQEISQLKQQVPVTEEFETSYQSPSSYKKTNQPMTRNLKLPILNNIQNLKNNVSKPQIPSNELNQRKPTKTTYTIKPTLKTKITKEIGKPQVSQLTISKPTENFYSISNNISRKISNESENAPLINRENEINTIKNIIPQQEENLSSSEQEILIPKKEKREETLMKVYNNDQKNIFRYIEIINLRNSSLNMTESIFNTTKSILKVIPKGSNETLEITFTILPPKNTTVNVLRNLTNSVTAKLVSSQPSDIINVQTKVGKKDKKISYVEMKITISPNTSLGRDIVEKERLGSEIENEFSLVRNLTTLLKLLRINVDEELREENAINVFSYYKRDWNKNISMNYIEKAIKYDLYSIVSKILTVIKKTPNSDELNWNGTIKTIGNTPKYCNYLCVSLKKILEQYLPFEDVKISATPIKSNTTLISVSLKPRTNFTTSPIDLDNLNILDMESILTKIISKYITHMKNSNTKLKTIIVNFIFKTTHISSLNLENIESAIEDVFNYFNVRSELLSDIVKMELIKNKFILIRIPFEISFMNLETVSTTEKIQTQRPIVKIPKPSEMISDLDLLI